MSLYSNNELFLAAVRKRKFDEAKTLLDAGADINFTNLSGETPLMSLTSPQTMDLMSWLLRNGANPNIASTSKETPLHRAISVESVDLVDLLVKNGADVNAKDQFNVTPLMLVAVSEYARAHEMASIIASAPGIDLDQASDDGTAPVMAAAARGKSEILKVLLDAGSNPEALDYLGYGLLHSAAMAPNPSEVFTVIFETIRTLDVNYKSFSGATPLSMLSGRPNAEQAISMLIDLGADPNAKQSNRFSENITPIFSSVIEAKCEFPKKIKEKDKAAASNNPMIGNSGINIGSGGVASIIGSFAGSAPPPNSNPLLDKMIAAGADVHARLDSGHSPLYFAIRNGSISSIKALVAAGIDPTRPPDMNGTSVYDMFSSLSGEYETTGQEAMDIFEDLYKLGFKFSRPVWDESIDGEVTDKMLSSLSTDESFQPMTSFTCSGQIDIVKKMLALNANIDDPSLSGLTTLHVLSSMDYDGLNQNEKKSIELFSRAKNVDQATKQSQIDEVKKAGADRMNAIMDLLIENSSAWNYPDKNGNTPLHYAAASGSEQWVSFLISNGADPSIKNKSGKTPAVTAMLKGHPEVYGAISGYCELNNIACSSDFDLYKIIEDLSSQELKERLAVKISLTSLDFTKEQLEFKDADGKTPLMLAAANDMNDMVRMLLAMGADPNAVDNNGNNALMYAAFTGSCENSLAIMSYGVDPAVKNNAGQTPMDVAIYKKDRYLERDLKSSPAKPEVVEITEEEAKARTAYHESIKQKAEVLSKLVSTANSSASMKL